MSRQPSPWTPQDKLNRSTPAAADVGLGDIVNDLITQHNALRVDFEALATKYAALLAKLDTAGATVGAIGTNNAATLARPASTSVAVKVLSLR